VTTLLCEKIILIESKEVKTGSKLVESSKEGYGSKSAVFLMMMMMIVSKLSTAWKCT
jgi:hypothetical protein